ncbi:MAG: hypothetical protein FWC28_02235 [Proteobacteria bacterium]|nr:hypothetical protein [Cystobacterineae bacterium]MCL2259180.1 hypothetical protein [Cystobacterineae bacterium]MCL2314057.1 hypothetical protein [Pseudomonadota bacterium]
MKKLMMLLVVAMATMMFGCKDDCEKAADVGTDAREAYCKGKSCEACKCINNSKAEGCPTASNSDSNVEVKCEGTALTDAEKCLDNESKCKDDAVAGIKAVCD